MTCAAEMPLTRCSEAPERSLARLSLTDVVAILPLLWWGTWLTWGYGGRDPHVLSVGLLLAGAALVRVRPWHRVPVWLSALLIGVGVAAFGVVATAPTGWAGANEASSYAYAALMAWLVLGWAQDDARRTAVLGVVVTASLLEFAKGFVPWWGSGSSEGLFVGTFYWHNQVGIFLVMGVAVGLPLILHRRGGAVPLLAWLAVPLCGAGVFFTTSRGSQIALGLGYAGSVLLVCLRRDRSVRSWLTLLTAAGATYAVNALLTGPPFFADRVVATFGAGARPDDFTGNGVQRLEFWEQSVHVFARWPLSGAGFHSFSSAATEVTPGSHAGSAFVHNGLLQALSDGGLLLALPLTVALCAAGLWGLRGLRAAIRRGDLVRPAAFGALLLLVLHSGMDFDWSYPALLTGTALVGAVVGEPLVTRGAVSRRTSGSLLALSLALVVLSAAAAWHGGLDLNVSIAGTS